MYWKILLTIFILLSAVSVSLAEEKNITPYGDYCKDCAAYGACKDALSLDESVKSLSRYYDERGLRVGAIQHKGRFIVADIYKENKQVDRVLFDMKSGRLRSIY